jgi:signal transduction histidine kinase
MKLRVGGLHLQLLALVVLPFSLILLVVALTGVGVHQGAMRQLVAERDERSARAAAAAISEQLHHRQAAMRGLALSAQGSESPERALQDAAFLFPDFDGGLAVTDRQGVVLSSSAPGNDWVGRPLHPWIDTLIEDRSDFSGPFVEGGESMVMVGAPADQVLVLGAFSTRSLLQAAMLSTMVSSGEGSAYLVDSSGELLAGVGDSPPEQDLLVHPGVRAALRGEIGSHYLEAADGEHVVAFSQVQPTGWALVVEEPWASVASPALEISLAAPLVLIPALLITLVALWFGARQVIQPLRRLQQQAEDLADSRYDRVGEPVGGIAEIQQLQTTLTGMAKGIRAAHEALQSYIGSITLAQEEERRRLARELHDATIQDLIALDHRIQLIQQQTQSAAKEGPDALEGLRPDISRSIQELRRLTGALRPIFLEDLGLVPALEMLVKDARRDLGVEVSFQLDGQPRRLGPEAELAIFRIVQEALSNVGRHAEAGQANVHLTFDRETVRVQVQDHGKGFEPPARITELASAGHYGLLGMRERAQLVGAQFSLNSAPGGGTRISVELPLQP